MTRPVFIFSNWKSFYREAASLCNYLPSWCSFQKYLDVPLDPLDGGTVSCNQDVQLVLNAMDKVCPDSISDSCPTSVQLSAELGVLLRVVDRAISNIGSMLIWRVGNVSRQQYVLATRIGIVFPGVPFACDLPGHCIDGQRWGTILDTVVTESRDHPVILYGSSLPPMSFRNLLLINGYSSREVSSFAPWPAVKITCMFRRRRFKRETA